MSRLKHVEEKNCIRVVVRSISSENADHGKVNPHDYIPDERIFHAPCIFLPDVSNTHRVGHIPDFPRRWEATRATRECQNNMFPHQISNKRLQDYRNKI